jgi:hypothetical protein
MDRGRERPAAGLAKDGGAKAKEGAPTTAKTPRRAARIESNRIESNRIEFESSSNRSRVRSRARRDGGARARGRRMLYRYYVVPFFNERSEDVSFTAREGRASRFNICTRSPRRVPVLRLSVSE